MLIIDVFNAAGSVALLVCAIVCSFAVKQGQVRRKAREFKQFFLARVLEF